MILQALDKRWPLDSDQGPLILVFTGLCRTNRATLSPFCDYSLPEMDFFSAGIEFASQAIGGFD